MGTFRGVELDAVELEGERLLLRRWAPGDAERVHAVMHDRAMHRFIALPDPYTERDARSFVEQLGDEGRGDGSGLGSAVVERTTGRVVGSAALRLTGDPEIGYWIARDAQGHGYAAEAVRLLTAWGFERGLRRIRVACDVGNLASARTALAAGFQFEGVGRDGVTSAATSSTPERRGDLARFARLRNDPAGPVPYAIRPLPPAGLEDTVLRLRTMRPEDATALAETDDELTLRWSFTGRAHTAEEVRQTTEHAALNWLVGRGAAFTMQDLATGRAAGFINLRLAGPPQVGGIGYVVHPAFRGRGYTARALRLLAAWAFDVADFARLELGAKVGNDASTRAAAAAGFESDGIRRGRLRNPEGTFADEQRFAALNPRYTREVRPVVSAGGTQPSRISP